MILEIEYSFQSDKQSPAVTSWTYFFVKGDDLDKNKKKAQTYWKRFVADLGWQKKVKLLNIEEIQNGKSYTPNHVIVDTRELPPARQRRSAPKAPSRTSSPRKRATPRSKKS